MHTAAYPDASTTFHVALGDGTALHVAPYDFAAPPAPRTRRHADDTPALLATVARDVAAEVMGGEPSAPRLRELAETARRAGRAWDASGPWTTDRPSFERLATHVARLTGYAVEVA